MKLSIGNHVLVKRSTGDIVKAQIISIYDKEIRVLYYLEKEKKIREKIVKKDEIIFRTNFPLKYGLLVFFLLLFLFLIFVFFFRNQTKMVNYNFLRLK